MAAPLYDIHRAADAPALMRIVTRKVLEREAEIASSNTATSNRRIRSEWLPVSAM